MPVNYVDFDLLECPLEGKVLIEASAGTGKTFSIAGLFLRLLIEKKYSVQEILVVTFTHAATEELKNRIRLRIRQAWNCVSKLCSEKHQWTLDDVIKQDEFIGNLFIQYENQAEPSEQSVWSELKTCLNIALVNFDEAQISTIHSFCQKILQENTFSSNSLFSAELVNDSSSMMDEVTQDFWRKKGYQDSKLLSSILYDHFSPETLQKTLPNNFESPDVVYSLNQDENLDILLQNCAQKYDLLAKTWSDQEQKILEILGNDSILNKKKERIQIIKWLKNDLKEGQNSYISNENNKFLKYLDPKELDGLIKAKGRERQKETFSNHSFFLQYKEYIDSCNAIVNAIKKDYIDDVKITLKKRKQVFNIRFFNDLLMDVFNSLNHENSSLLIDSLREKYPVALIDEFQDTDSIQYSIFEKIYCQENQEYLPFFLIGDPKQAIYGFRGGDI
ncbi:MAG: exodeoxyribonuclease V beta subunit, partial [bacterium]